ncbi:alpha amylase [Neokomagataea thailandica NBRC 106555]|uniref:Glucohydrolase n=2 Tax=Neokomagataea TaxID=1223423 RepID=A0A4Y6V7E3_9PROT|nr:MULTISPECIES: alpha-amylase family glycosyl hydrolase [Neokomagataea]QDH24561.1 glucohydrolase [Neokomagataea tanensis]GBR52434.1 alpha amylase [Neokomagataea thailandica NBRC 106555]
MKKNLRSLFLGLLLSATALPSLSLAKTAPAEHPWWESATIYEIYPRSFQDTKASGTGDLKGITQRLDYLKSLGITAIWITPFYPSPGVDFGYDISNCEDVDPLYGNLKDFDNLLAEAKKRNIKIVIDVVLNQTSDKHPWFEESRKSRNNPKSDYYVWMDPKGFDKSGKPIPPNNWQNWFGHTAWTYDDQRKQFFYHDYAKEQPDLNWRNPAVKDAMFKMIRFWLDRGVDGIRLDSIFTIYEDPSFKDEPYLLDKNGNKTLDAFGETATSQVLQGYQPELHPLMRDLRKMFDSYPGSRALIGETYGMDIGGLDAWYGGKDHNELNLPMDVILGIQDQDNNFVHLDVSQWRKNLNDAVTKIHNSEPLLVIDNHDNLRADRFCAKDFGGKPFANCTDIQKMLATVLFASRSSVLMYYGDEIGMSTNTPQRVEDVRDPEGKAGWPKDKGRDAERTPMQWDTTLNAGFSKSPTTWLPVGASYTSVNVDAEEIDPNSMLNWYKNLISLKNNNLLFKYGSQEVIEGNNSQLLIFKRVLGNKKAIVINNFSGFAQKFDFDGQAKILTQSFVGNVKTVGGYLLPPYGAMILDLQ